MEEIGCRTECREVGENETSERSGAARRERDIGEIWCRAERTRCRRDRRQRTRCRRLAPRGENEMPERSAPRGESQLGGTRPVNPRMYFDFEPLLGVNERLKNRLG
ncbi:unnamed protein product [Linum trigynum]|uniref:Uncharacterized protein n=1 Tax=Linum trigynum TaxID=586398 RepID=A0AAV2CI29_9ROSI